MNRVFFTILAMLLSLSLAAVECDFQHPLKIYKPKYAKHFTLSYFKDFKLAEVDHQRYLLLDSNDVLCQSDLPKVKTPVQKVVMMSTTYLPSLELLNKEKSLIAFPGVEYITSTKFQLSSIESISSKLNTEELLKMKMDLIMGHQSNLATENQAKTLQKFSIPFVLNRDFEEVHPLARAEWLVYIASFYNLESRAIELFNDFEKNYNDLKNKNNKKLIHPRVLVGEIQNGYWVTCGADSDLGRLISDAGGTLALIIPSAQTQTISLEKIVHLPSLDIWLTHNQWIHRRDYDEARLKDTRYHFIKVRDIYNNNLKRNAKGYSDYWEMGLQRPDLMLKDLSAIIYPNDFPHNKLEWYQKL